MYEWTSGVVGPAGPLIIPEARRTIRHENQASKRRFLVLDDDPTGSQAVHGVIAVTTPDVEAIAAALDAPGSTCFVLTNSRSLSEPEATKLAGELASIAAQLETQLGGTIEIISRSDSTLRGHVLAEIEALQASRRAVRGQGYDGILLIPSYFEAGRFTASNIHWAKLGDRNVAVGDTEFARDATFGYSNSDLRLFIEEKSAGSVLASDVVTISLEDIRGGGPERIEQILLEARNGAFVVVNCVEYADLDVVVLGLHAATKQGRCFLYRTGPSFVQVLAGVDPIPPLDSSTIWPGGAPKSHGLVIVGSHVGLTNRQIDTLKARSDINEIIIDVNALVDPSRSAAAIANCVETARHALVDSDVLLVTSRLLRTGEDGDESLRLARAVSSGVVEIVRELLSEHPGWVIAKGGITSHDVLVKALGVRSAEVVGQLFPGFVSVFRALQARPEAIGMPCVVFAGNVGNDDSLADAVAIMQAN